MKKLLPAFQRGWPVLIVLVVLFYSLIPSFQRKTSGVLSDFIPKGNFKVDISASVGEFYLNISGFISPYASIVMTTPEGSFLRSAVADSKGIFYISQVLIKKGFSGFCLTAVDFKRLGESTTCFSFPPATGGITMRDLFLPPTLGLLKNEVTAGGEIVAYGYTMPFATVTITLSDGRKVSVTADSTGYYVFRIKDLKSGAYQLFATARHEGKDSLSPTKSLTFKVMSLWDQFLVFIRNILNRISEFFTSLGLGPLWLGIPIIILIIILILKLWPESFTFVYQSKLVVFFSKKSNKKKLHHAWFIGY